MNSIRESVDHVTSPGELRDAFDRWLFVDLIAIVAVVATPSLFLVAALLDRPYVLVGLAIVIPALAAVPVALERRHRCRRCSRASRGRSVTVRPITGGTANNGSVRALVGVRPHRHAR